jgi:uncharacterized protein YjiS (DUF1127 family)
MEDASKAGSAASPLRDLLARALSAVAAWRARGEGRRALARLDTRALKDIGLSEGQARWEMRKRFWQP